MPLPSSDNGQGYFWPIVWAVSLHVLLFAFLFVSFSSTPELPEARPIVQATLYELKSKSPATVQTNQKIAGEAAKTAARQHEVEQLEQRKVEQQRQEQRAAEQKRAEEARKLEEAKKAEAAKAEQARQAEVARKKAEEEKKKAEEQKRAEEQKKREAERKRAEEQKKREEEAKRRQAQEAARRSEEEKRAQALAELLSDTTERQAAIGDEIGDSVSGNFDDLIRLRAAEGWSRPPSARANMSVTLRVTMVPDGTITSVNVSRGSGDVAFDNSAVAAVRNIGRISEMRSLKPHEFNRYRSFTMTFTPEDLAL